MKVGLITLGCDKNTVDSERYLAELSDYSAEYTSQLEQADLHKAYGHTLLTYNRPAIAPLGECKSNWDVMRLSRMMKPGFTAVFVA